ncbi:MAG: type II secretion system protein [Lachnospiraceae bacterium]|nr:type II secretion system protein [Lachnospiraceae bacterium]
MKSAFRRCAADMWRRRQEQQQTNNRRNHQGTGGFTLVELIVTLVVLGILLTVGVMSLRGWQDYAEFKKNDEFAQSIFVAAQTQLTQYAERGQLTNLADAASADGKAGAEEYLLSKQEGTLYGTDGAAIDLNDTPWEKDAKDKANTSEIYFLKAAKGDYANIYLKYDLGNKTTVELKKEFTGKDLKDYRRIKALFDMLDPYIADKDMLNGAICVEFDPNPKVALIYSVFYDDKVKEFTYLEEGAEGFKNYMASIRHRAREKRKDKKVGYYGAEVLSRGTNTKIVQPIIGNLTLRDEDTLNLYWTIKGQAAQESKEALTGLIYRINLFAAPDSVGGVGTRVGTITLGTADDPKLVLKGTRSADGIQRIAANYAYPIAEGNEWGNKTLEFPIKINEGDNSICLYLDALDLSVNEGVENTSDTASSSASIYRLGLDQTDNLYAVVVGSREGTYRQTIEKTSNTENQFFGKLSVRPLTGGSESRTYTIENARHLNNIRYYERYHKNETKKITYRLTADINWEAALNNGSVYQKMVPVLDAITSGDKTPADYKFRSIISLGANSSLITEETEDAHVLKKFAMSANLTADPAAMPDVAGYNLLTADSVPTDTIGLIIRNQGTISNIAMEDAAVTGSAEEKTGSSTGAFCGKNEGNLAKLTLRSGTVTGNINVGGITGAISGAGSYEELTNRAEVSGRRYVGGIAGRMEADSGNLTVNACKNYGKVHGIKIEEGSDAYFIGGITGYSRKGDSAEVVISKCSSSPAYTEEEITDLVNSIKEKIESANENAGNVDPSDVDLTGTFVGGIVGFNQDASITDCNTLRERITEPGYVIGKNYVGGIVGLNAGTAGGRLHGGSANSRNQASIIGETYVGGITGCNAKVTLSDTYPYQVTIDPDHEKNKDAVISNWVNEGAILAISTYGGGITGANYGTISDCNSDVDYNSVVQNMTGLTMNSRYAGGIAGYNQGSIAATSGVISAVSVISGRDYVGGLVGYNDIGGTIKDYKLSGGYVTGKHFVGGFIGLNADKSVFDSNIISNVNEVSGDYFVGGIIGANLLPTDEAINAVFQTDNFLGNLNAEQGAFAGGFIGFNDLLTAGTGRVEIQEAVDALCNSKEFKAITETDGNAISDRLEAAEALIGSDTFLSSNQNETDQMTITGSENVSAQTKLGEITALVYVGGVVGYNQDKTILAIHDVENITPINATAYIQRTETGVSDLPDGTQKKYSYVGGIIGKVAENVTLVNCKNRDVGEVRTQGTYTGGLAELNYGLIQNCTAGSLGSGTSDDTDDYIGGLVGANVAAESNRGIVNCGVTGTIMGRNYVGGLAAENYGRIADPVIQDCSIMAAGANVGGIAGYGYSGSAITFSKEQTLDVEIDGSAYYVGGVVGSNEGTLKGLSGSRVSTSAGKTIVGLYHVGGFIGRQLGKAEISNLNNQSDVQADQGYAGGIVASMSKDQEETTIQDCQNSGEVSVLSETDEIEDEEVEDSAAGGITAVNYGTISRCVDYGEVYATSGYSGGITALNYSTIKKCRVNDGRTTLEMSGDRYVGGITAINGEKAVIVDCSVQNLILQNQTSTEAGYMGGVAAYNYGTIENTSVGVDWAAETSTKDDDDYDYDAAQEEAVRYVLKAVEKAKNSSNDSAYTFSGLTSSTGVNEVNAVTITSYAAGVCAGGVTGWNEGTIKGDSGTGNYSVAVAEIGFIQRSMSYYGYMGGIAGVNRGEISKYEFDGLIHATANDPNNTPEFNPNYDYEQNKAPIYGYGGIAGMNGNDQGQNDASVKNCKISAARIQGTGDANNRSNIGGIAGMNGENSVIEGIYFGSGTSQDFTELGTLFSYTGNAQSGNVTKNGSIWLGTDSYGHVGGVTGYNLGTITEINDKDEEYKNNGVLIIDNSGHAGGIAGFNRRTGTISQAVTGENWMVVAKAHGQDNGTGGIIGYNISESDLTNCDNYATVIKMAGDSVGGMIGRNENATTSSWRLYNCRNYGPIYARARAGGMIGHWKYKGGTLEKCINEGNVIATVEGAGGMVGMLYSLDSGESANMVQCENHGTVGDNNAVPTGGMLGMVYNPTSSGRNIRLYQCVNTGLIGGTDLSAGMIANASNATIYLSYCRNYGYSLNNYSTNFNGMSASKVENLTDCIAVTDKDIANPISAQVKTTTTGGYYFNQASAETRNSFFYVKQIEANNKKLVNGNLLSVMTNGANTESPNPYYTGLTTSDDAWLEMTFNAPVYLDAEDSLLLVWNRAVTSAGSNDYRYYSYTLELFDKNNKVIESLEVNEKEGGDTRAEYFNGHTHDIECSEPVYKVRISNIFARTWGSNTMVNVALSEFTAKGVRAGDFGVDNITSAVNYKSTSYENTTTQYNSDKTMVSCVWDLSSLEAADNSGKGVSLSVADNVAISIATGRKIASLNGKTIADIYRSEEKNDRYTSSAGAYQLFQDLDAYLFFERDDSSLAVPEITSTSAEGGYYQVNWGQVDQAQYYQVKYTYYQKDADGKLTQKIGEEKSATVYIPQIQIASDYTDAGKKADGIIVQVQACCPILNDGGTAVAESEWSAKREVTFGIQLPTPQVHYELVKIDAKECYRVVLDNQSEYKIFVEQQRLAGSTIEMKDIKIVSTLNKRTAITFSAESGAYYDQNSDYQLVEGHKATQENILLTSHAEIMPDSTVSGYDVSANVIREATLPTNTVYQDSKASSQFLGIPVLERTTQATSVGFFGTTIQSLSYQTMLKPSGSWVVNYRTELTASDPDFDGLPVALAVSPQTRTSPSSGSTAVITLNNFPSDFLDKNEDGTYRYQDVMVRSYPTKMSNDIFYQGWQVTVPGKEDSSALSQDDLKQLKVNDNGQVDDDGMPLISGGLVSGKKVKEGYVIEAQGDGTYSLYYNTLLRDLEKIGYKDDDEWSYTQNGQAKTYQKYQVVYHKIDLKEELTSVQSKPAIHINPVKTDDGTDWLDGDYETADKFAIMWDQEAKGADPAYKNSDGVAPFNKNAEYFLTVTGTLPDDKTTTLINNRAIKTADGYTAGIYNQLEQDSSKWSYKKVHITLTRAGTTDSKGHVTSFPITVDAEYSFRLRLSQIGKPVITLKRDEQGVVMKDGLNYVISWSGLTNEEERKALAYYEITVTGKESKTEQTFTTEEISAESGVTDPKQTKRNVNLEAFTRGEQLQVKIRAIADKTSITYRSGIDGTIGEMTLPERLFAPDMGEEQDPDANLTAAPISVTSVSDFLAGCLSLTMKPENYDAGSDQTTPMAGTQYQIAIQLFATREEADQADPTDAITTITGLPEKSDTNRTNMTKGLTDYSYVLKDIPAKYAGTWARVILRAVSSGNISSVWTEDDKVNTVEDYTAVVPYRIFELPKVQIDPIELDEVAGSETIEYPVLDAQGKQFESLTVELVQDTVSFTEADYAQNYNLKLIGTPQNAGTMATPSDAVVVSDVSELSLKRTDEDTFAVEYEATDLNYKNTGTGAPITLTIGAEKPTALPYGKELQLLGTAYHIEPTAYLQAERETDTDGQERIRFILTLPDFSQLLDEGQISADIAGINYTEQILIQSVPKEDETQYQSSLWAVMAREDADSPLDKVEAIAMDLAAIDPEPIDAQAKASERSGAAYEIEGTGLTSATRYLVEVSQGDKKLGMFAVPRNQDAAGVLNYKSFVWLPEWMAQYQDSDITLTFRNIFDVGSAQGGGLSAWSETARTVTLGALTTVQEVSLVQLLSGGENHPISTYSRVRSNQTGQSLNAKQSQITWVYDPLEDAKITGYNLNIEGTDGQTDCHLKLDLSRNAFGQYPGLADYLTAEGKLLYSIGYDLEGDRILYPGQEVPLASDSDAAFVTASDSNTIWPTASDSDAQEVLPIGTVLLKATLKAEWEAIDDEVTGIRFTLTLPDAPADQWKGSSAETYLKAFEGEGMYHTERLKVEPILVNKYYTMPETEWFYLQKTIMEYLEDGELPEENSGDGALVNDLT